jgi:hypothetical protein
MEQIVHSSSLENGGQPSSPATRRELRAWARDLVAALGLAMVIIVFFYQPVKVEGTSMAPLISDQERIFINKFVYRLSPSSAETWWSSGIRWTAPSRSLSGWWVCRATW